MTGKAEVKTAREPSLMEWKVLSASSRRESSFKAQLASAMDSPSKAERSQLSIVEKKKKYARSRATDRHTD